MPEVEESLNINTQNCCSGRGRCARPRRNTMNWHTTHKLLPPVLVLLFWLCRVTSVTERCVCVCVCVRSSSGEDEGEVIHMGNAIMSFYSALIDLLGRCAPEMHVRLSSAICAAITFSNVNVSQYEVGRVHCGPARLALESTQIIKKDSKFTQSNNEYEWTNCLVSKNFLPLLLQYLDQQLQFSLFAAVLQASQAHTGLWLTICPAPSQLINAGKGEALRIRAILRSLVPTVDLVGTISIPLRMPVVHRGEVSFVDSLEDKGGFLFSPSMTRELEAETCSGDEFLNMSLSDQTIQWDLVTKLLNRHCEESFILWFWS